jgi:hypothetical protein
LWLLLRLTEELQTPIARLLGLPDVVSIVHDARQHAGTYTYHSLPDSNGRVYYHDDEA